MEEDYSPPATPDLSHFRAPSSIINMSTFSLTVNVNSSDIAALKAAGYKLCIAKKVNNTYNTVWRGSSFLAHNQFQWTSRYEVFGTNTFAEGALVTASTETPEIKYGQTAIIDKDGSMGNAKGTPDSSGTFTVDNEYAAMNIGVMGYLGGTFSPIFVSPEPLVTGTIGLTPIETVLVWFDATHVTSTIITTSISNTIEVSYNAACAEPETTPLTSPNSCLQVDFTGGIATRSVTYASTPGRPGTGAWALDGQLRLAATFHPQTNLFEVEKPSPPLLLKMASLINSQKAASGYPSAFKVTLEFNDADVQAGVVQTFEDYAKGARPDGLRVWNVSTDDSAVVVYLAIQHDDDAPAAAAKKIPYTFLGILHGWTGAQYTKLTFEAPEGREALQLLFLSAHFLQCSQMSRLLDVVVSAKKCDQTSGNKCEFSRVHVVALHDMASLEERILSPGVCLKVAQRPKPSLIGLVTL
ncbi:hypothetical protein BC628DRAFT_477441 [Trametes gibbosa]|nr:hypothetical protein BC628DRAFT_477441 [Trametes gibbosa]